DGPLPFQPRGGRLRRRVRRDGRAVAGARLPRAHLAKAFVVTGAPAYAGIDVGTGSARAAIFDASGRRLGLGGVPVQVFRPEPDFVEQSSDDIWRACGKAVRDALRQAGFGPADLSRIQGIGFDATCSLVALDEADAPVTVSPTGRDEQNVVVWMDH